MALVELELDRSGGEFLRRVDGGLQHLPLGREPEAVVDELGIFRHELVLEVGCAAVKRDGFDPAVRRKQNGAARRLVHAARLHADETVLDEIEPADAVCAPERVERSEQIRGRKPLAIERDRVAALEIDHDITGLIGRRLRIERARIDVVRHLLRRVLQHLALRRGMQQIRVDGKWRLAALILRDGDLMLLGKGDERLARAKLPFPPRCDHGHIGLERVIAEFETHLVVALAGRRLAMSGRAIEVPRRYAPS